MIPRTQRLAEVRQFLRDFKIVGLSGPRQVGKTTLAREIAATFSARSTGFDLERPEDVAQRQEPELKLASLRGLVVIDEIQRRPDLFPVLRVLADRRPLPGIGRGAVGTWTEWPLLLHQTNLQTRHLPIRQLMERSSDPDIARRRAGSS